MGSWDQSLTLYNLGNGASGAKEGKRIPLTFDPLSIKYVHDGEFLLVAGTGNAIIPHNNRKTEGAITRYTEPVC